MKWVDRSLFTLALCSLFTVIFIVYTDEVAQADSHETIREDMVVYSEQIDKAIESYFSEIKQHPEIAEEEKRLIEDLSSLGGGDEADLNAAIEKPSESVQELTSAANVASKVEKTKSPQPRKADFHIVRSGESLWRISKMYNIPVYSIVAANPDKASRVIRPGDKILLPPEAGVYHRVSKGETLSEIARRYKANLSRIREENKIAGSTIYVKQRLFIPGGKPLPVYRYVRKKVFRWPIRGRITSRYGWRRNPFNRRRQFHTGVDIGAVRGTAIRAAGKGVVIFSGNGGTYGNLVILKHRNNLMTVYAHCSKILVKKGRVVRKGQIIARVGNTGLSTGSHLHFEVRRGRKQINPYSILKIAEKVQVRSQRSS